MGIYTCDLMKMKVSFFRDANTRDHLETTLYDCLVTIPQMYQQWYKDLRGMEDKAAQKAAKVNFPLFTPSAVCGDDENGIGTRKHEFVISKNNIIVIDIDKDKNQWLNDETIPKLKNALMSMSYVYAVSISIRGNGLFAVIPIENADNIREHFNALEKDFREAGIILDTACKDLTRARFLSYDPDVRIKEDTEIEIYNKKYNPHELDDYTKRIIEQRRISNQMRYGDDENRLKYALDYLFDECGYCGTGDYNEWIHEAFMLSALVSKFGYVYCLDKFMTYSRNTPGFKNPDDVTRKFENITNTNKNITDIDSYYFGKLKRQIGNDWVKRLNDYIEKRQINIKKH